MVETKYTNEELVFMYQNETVEYKKQLYASMLYKQIEGLEKMIANRMHVCNHDFDDKRSLLGVVFHRCIKSYKEGMSCKFSSYYALSSERILMQHHELQRNSPRKMKWDESMIDSMDTLMEKRNEIHIIKEECEFEDAIFLTHYENVLEKYSEKERKIIELLASGVTYKEVGSVIGVSKQRVSHITQKMFPKLYTDLTGDTYDKNNFKKDFQKVARGKNKGYNRKVVKDEIR